MSIISIIKMIARFVLASSLIASQCPRPGHCFSVLASTRGNKSQGSSAMIHPSNIHDPALSSNWLQQWPAMTSHDLMLQRFLGDIMSPKSIARLEMDIKESPEKLEIQVDVLLT